MVSLIDTTFRDGAQAHWSGRLSTEQVLPVILSIDKAGFLAMDFMAPLQFEISVKFLNENPWERVRAVRRVAKRTPLATHVRSRSLASFDLMPIEAIKLFIERAASNGFRRIMIFDGLHDIENMRPSIAHARETGLHVTPVIFYTVSPYHTDEYYGRVAAKYAQLGADSVCLRDPSGLLTVERTRTLIPILRNSLGPRPLELKSHCTTGLAPACYIEAMKSGVDALFTAASPLANGPSVPATEDILAAARSAGVRIPVDAARVSDVAEYLTDIAASEDRPLGRAVEAMPAAQYEHQVPGGMIAFLKDQLRNLGQEQKLPQVLEEIPLVREDMGYPVMVTPISQLVGVQAVLNVLHGRYEFIPNEVRRYVLGHYGKPEGPLNGDLVDRVASEPLQDPGPAQENLVDRVRREFGPFESDDDLVLHIMFHHEQLRKIPPYNRARRPELAPSLNDIAKLLTVLRERRRIGYLSVSCKGADFTVSR